jgi:hypothetical protein
MKDDAWMAVALIAGVASTIAILANADLSVAIPLAAVAVAAASLLLIEIVEKTKWPARVVYPTVATDPAGVRSSLKAGVRGRFPLVLLLDSLDRHAGNPDVHGSSMNEIKEIEAMPADEFRGYLDRRIREVERRT